MVGTAGFGCANLPVVALDERRAQNGALRRDALFHLGKIRIYEVSQIVPIQCTYQEATALARRTDQSPGLFPKATLLVKLSDNRRMT